MKPFINESFLLGNKTAEKLYHEYAENLPIIDFHSHLPPNAIAENRQFENLAQVWLEEDHYKWRAMRMNGVDESYCTGKAPEIEKYNKWAETVPATIGNPLYHWTHLELARYFNIFKLLSPATAKEIFEETSSMLKLPDFSARSLLKRKKVELVCTTDDPIDDLRYHLKLKDYSVTKVLPTFRPDNVVKTENPEKYSAYIRKLETSSEIEIKSFGTLIEAIDKRHDFFHQAGGRLSDHGLARFYYADYTESEINKIISKLLSGKHISFEETEKYKTAIMIELCRMNHKRGWTQQFHTSPLRDNNVRMFQKTGPDAGFDSIAGSVDPVKMAQFFNALDYPEQLANTIIYNLNPADNIMIIAMIGNFNDGSPIAKMQYGAAWWFQDQKNGIEKHLQELSSIGLLSRFTGMVTDSRSLLSYPRHEYFRRILCNYIGEEVEKGAIPDDDALLQPIIEGVSYFNAKNYFNFDN